MNTELEAKVTAEDSERVNNMLCHAIWRLKIADDNSTNIIKILGILDSCGFGRGSELPKTPMYNEVMGYILDKQQNLFMVNTEDRPSFVAKRLEGIRRKHVDTNFVYLKG